MVARSEWPFEVDESTPEEFGESDSSENLVKESPTVLPGREEKSLMPGLLPPNDLTV